MANDFKAAAERKKKNAEVRKAKNMINQIEELLQEQADKLTDEEKTQLLATAENLKAVTEDASSEVKTIIGENEKAEASLHSITEKLNDLQKKESSSLEDEEVPAAEATEVPTEDPETVQSEGQQEKAPVEDEIVQEAPEQAEPVVQQQVPAEKSEPQTEFPEVDQKGTFNLSEELHRVYAAPRYSRIGGETKARFSAMIKPSLKEKMNQDAALGLIKSPNDLINVLLEIYYGDI